MKFQVRRSEWLRGTKAKIEGDMYSALLLERPDLPDYYNGKMCCLGFMCLAAGCTRDQIIGVPLPHRVAGIEDRPGLEFSFTLGAGGMVASIQCKAIASVNDESNLSDTVREASLIKLFAEAGHEVEFV